jgi:glycosyltransferase involved in cell wall biosynthesis
MRTPRRILALAAYSERVASTRFRLTEMLPYLRASGCEVRFEPFVDDDFLTDFYSKGRQIEKGLYLAARTFERLALAARVRDVDAVFIQREAALVGPAYTELILRSFKGLPIIMDFDDAIWDLNLSKSAHPIAARLLKDPNKCWYTMRRAAGVVGGSEYLAARAREVNSNVTVIPTVVSSESWTPLPERLSGKWPGHQVPRIGWVGTHTTAPQLELAAPALRRLRDEGHEFELHVVGAGEGFELSGLDARCRPWRLEAELSEFQQIDIGLAPMYSEPVYQGKCGFKQVQYMSVGVPFVSSWVGGARDFVVDGENGLVALNSDDWYRHIRSLLESEALRRDLSQGGRRLVEARLCAEVQGPRLVRFVEDTLGWAERSRRGN